MQEETQPPVDGYPHYSLNSSSSTLQPHTCTYHGQARQQHGVNYIKILMRWNTAYQKYSKIEVANFITCTFLLVRFCLQDSLRWRLVPDTSWALLPVTPGAKTQSTFCISKKLVQEIWVEPQFQTLFVPFTTKIFKSYDWPMTSLYSIYTGDWRVAYLKSTSPRRYTQVRVHTSICSSKSITKTPKIWFKKSKVISWSLQGNSAELPPYKPRSMRVQVNCMLWGMCYSESQMKHDFMPHGSGKC